MKSLMKSLLILLILVLSGLFTLCVQPAEGAVLRLSDHSSDDEFPYLTPYLDAEFDFTVVDDTLTLGVANLTPELEDDPTFKINNIYFNFSDKVQTLDLISATDSEGSPMSGWKLKVRENSFMVGGFGRFDVYLNGGHGCHPPVVRPGYTVNFDFQITGIGPFADTDFIALSSPVGGHIRSYAAAKFYNDDASAYGATCIPEPATVCLLGLGALVLVRRS